MITARDAAIVRRLEVTKEDDVDHFSSYHGAMEAYAVGLMMCVTFEELNVVILPKALNPRIIPCVTGVVQQIDWHDCSQVVRGKLHSF